MLKDYNLQYHNHWLLMGKEEMDKDLYLEMIDTCSEIQSIRDLLTQKDLEIDDINTEYNYLENNKEELEDTIWELGRKIEN